MTLKQISKNNKIKYCYITKRGLYYKPGSCGYTEFKAKAGIYKKEEALEHAESCDELTLIPIDINKHNALVMNEINELSTKYIYE